MTRTELSVAQLWRRLCSSEARSDYEEGVILKISIFEWTRETRFLLEGKLAHEWVHEAEKAWHSMEQARNGKHIVIDLCGVSFVDRAGEELLEMAAGAGAILIGADPMMRTLIEEIKARVAQRGTAKQPLNLVLVLILSGLMATLAIGCSLVL